VGGPSGERSACPPPERLGSGLDAAEPGRADRGLDRRPSVCRLGPRQFVGGELNSPELPEVADAEHPVAQPLQRKLRPVDPDELPAELRLSPNVGVHSWATVSDSVLMDDVEIGRHAVVRRAILDKGVVVPEGARIGMDPDEDLERGFTVPESGLPVVRGKKAISLERQVRIAAGFLVLLGALLGWLVHPAFIGLSAFIGAGLVFAGVTDTCGMGMLLARMPWNQLQETATTCAVR